MRSPRYPVVLFDLFGTLIDVDAATLPEVTIGGRVVRSTMGRWQAMLADLVPGLSVDAFGEALRAVSEELARARTATAVEFPSRERFRRTLARLEVADEVAVEVAPALARAHLGVIVAATRFPAERAAVLAEATARAAVAIVTNFDDTATAYEILDRHHILPAVRSVVVSEAVGLRKPHPALVRLALRDLAAPASAALMVGDNAVEDVGAAHAAEVDAAWIDGEGRGVPAGAPRARYVVRSLAEITPLLG